MIRRFEPPIWRVTPEPVIGRRFCADPVGSNPPYALLNAAPSAASIVSSSISF
jgi:hypothetical protein